MCRISSFVRRFDVKLMICPLRMDVFGMRRFAYEEVQGRATAVVLDLWENEVLWRGAADYSTARLYGDDGAIRRELDKTRAAAANRLAEFMSLLQAGWSAAERPRDGFAGPA